MEENNQVQATELVINYTINDSKFSDSFVLDSNDIQEIMNLAIDLIDQFSSKNIQITTPRTFMTDLSNIETKEKAHDQLITNIEKIKELESNYTEELSLTLK